MANFTEQEATDFVANAFKRVRINPTNDNYITHFISGKINGVRKSYHSSINGLNLNENSTEQEVKDEWISFLQTQTV